MRLFRRSLCVSALSVLFMFLVFVSPSRCETKWSIGLNQTIPDQQWVNYDGSQLKISDLQGKVVLVEFIGMTCPACQAFSGAHQKGGYQGISPQGDLRSIEKSFPQYSGGIPLSDDRIVFVQILLYSMSMQAPSRQDAIDWAKHFGLEQKRNTYVVVATESLIGPVSFNLIPGFALLDKKGVVRSLSAGHNPQQNLWTELLPLVNKLLSEL